MVAVKASKCILRHVQIILIFGKIDTLLEGGIFAFILTYPSHYPFEQPEMRTLLPLLHPHIYPY